MDRTKTRGAVYAYLVGIMIMGRIRTRSGPCTLSGIHAWVELVVQSAYLVGIITMGRTRTRGSVCAYLLGIMTMGRTRTRGPVCALIGDHDNG